MPSTTPPVTLSFDSSSVPKSDYDSDGIAKAFAEAGAPAPFVAWHPGIGMVDCRSTTAFHNACDQIADGKDAISEGAFDLSRFGSMKDWLSVVELARDGRAYYFSGFRACARAGKRAEVQ